MHHGSCSRRAGRRAASLLSAAMGDHAVAASPLSAAAGAPTAPRRAAALERA